MRVQRSPLARRGLLLTLAFSVLLPACRSLEAAKTGSARLVAPEPACLEELRQFIEASAGRPVVLTEASFASSDTLLLERPLRRNPEGLPLDGRAIDRPESFRLLTHDYVCIIGHAASGRERELKRCRCQALVP